MAISIDNAVAIASLYLALVGLLSTFFSVHLGEWLNGIQATESKWNQMRNRQPKDQFFSERLECYFQAASSAAPWTLVGWCAVTLFLVVILCFAEYLRSLLGPEASSMLFRLVHIPCYLFFGVYLLLSLAMLFIGYRKSRSIREDALKSL